MVIAGLVIALGEVVDDAIIDVENIVRRLRLNRAAEQPRSAFEVVLDASLEVRSAVVYASLIVMLVFVPIFFLDGLAGSFFRPLGARLHPGDPGLAARRADGHAGAVADAAAGRSPETGGSAADPAPEEHLRRLLPPLVARPLLSLGIVLLAFTLTGAAVTQLGEEFLPKFQETDFLMHLVEKPGTSLEAMHRMTIQASKELRAIPGVRNFGSHIGRAEVADEVVGPNFTELWISVDPNVDLPDTVAKIQAAVDGYPGLYRDVLTYLKERIKEVLTGPERRIVVRLTARTWTCCGPRRRRSSRRWPTFPA